MGMAEDDAPTVTETARTALLPLFRTLDERLDDERAREFFAGIAASIENAGETSELMAPFMELSTTAFRGFTFDAETTLLVDRVLEAAQTIAAALSTGSDTMH